MLLDSRRLLASSIECQHVRSASIVSFSWRGDVAGSRSRARNALCPGTDSCRGTAGRRAVIFRNFLWWLGARSRSRDGAVASSRNVSLGICGRQICWCSVSGLSGSKDDPERAGGCRGGFECSLHAAQSFLAGNCDGGAESKDRAFLPRFYPAICESRQWRSVLAVRRAGRDLSQLEYFVRLNRNFYGGSDWSAIAIVGEVETKTADGHRADTDRIGSVRRRVGYEMIPGRPTSLPPSCGWPRTATSR